MNLYLFHSFLVKLSLCSHFAAQPELTPLEQFLLWSLQVDVGKPAPDLQAANELIGETSVELGEGVARTRLAVLYQVKSDPNQIIRYQVGEGSGTDCDAVIRHAFFLHFFMNLGFVPRLYYISPAARLPAKPTSKTDFKQEASDYISLHRRKKTVRFMVIENVGRSVFRWVADVGRPSFATGITLLKDLISKLKIIHEAGIVHGDVHPGNVLSRELNTGEVSLIDFE